MEGVTDGEEPDAADQQNVEDPAGELSYHEAIVAPACTSRLRRKTEPASYVPTRSGTYGGASR
jgi:hypothetical protein